MLFNTSGPILAVKTVTAINTALEADQGRKFRRLLRETMPLAEDAYRDDEDDGFRSHLGASLVGRDCSRELWYTFRWATRVQHKGSLLRLFNRGHLEEPRFVALLRMIDCEVWQLDENKNQFRVSHHNGHFGGSLDSVVRGVPDYPDAAILGEYKTHNEKSFAKLLSEGVRGAKFEHYVQMQVYMGGYALPAALYLAVNKNNDELHGEIVPFDPEQYARYYERAGNVISAPNTSPPPKISNSPGWYKCKICDHLKVCQHDGTLARNCRTCTHSSPSVEGSWVCEVTGKKLTKEEQIKACPEYRWLPL